MANKHTWLTAVNKVLRQGTGIAQITALDSTGTWPNKVFGKSEHGHVEELIDQATRAYLTNHNGAFNTLFNQSGTPSGSPLGITLPANALAVNGRGFFLNWPFSVGPNNKLMWQASETLPVLGFPYEYHVRINVDFEQCPADVQEDILESVCQQANLIKNRDAVTDAMLAGRVAVQNAKPKGTDGMGAFDGEPLMQTRRQSAAPVRVGT